MKKIMAFILLVFLFNGCNTVQITKEGLNKEVCSETLRYAGEGVDAPRFLELNIPLVYGDKTKVTVLSTDPLLAELLTSNNKSAEKYEKFKDDYNTSKFIINAVFLCTAVAASFFGADLYAYAMHDYKNNDISTTLGNIGWLGFGLTLVAIPCTLFPYEGMKTNLKDAIGEYNASCGN